MINWIIKNLGGYTSQEYKKAEYNSARKPLLLSSPKSFQWLRRINDKRLHIHSGEARPHQLRGLEPSVLIIDYPIQEEELQILKAHSLHVVDLRSPHQREY